ncbi:hypothetical protein CPT_Shady_051 [Streptomyces phage Shady]|uniref:Uncharacterized protein n=1 Tax=Streptomyces phage Shady TaxID=2767585 RepID=A0A873WLF3_9CAUD|nr:hypothetical protein CPT_Shady_051 [Streptomyces phage Shady]
MQNAQGKGQTWFPGKTCVDVDVRYYLEWTDRPDAPLNRLTERKAAEMIRTIKAKPELGEVFTVVREVRERIANACVWCGSRPRTWDMDCDGPYENVTCDTEQCTAGRYGE